MVYRNMQIIKRRQHWYITGDMHFHKTGWEPLSVRRATKAGAEHEFENMMQANAEAERDREARRADIRNRWQARQSVRATRPHQEDLFAS